MTEALVAWEWFTSEFDYGGLIDSPTAEEKELAWMSTTNEVNEGWLGGWQLFARTNLSSTIEQYNNIAMFWKNNTQKFMNTLGFEDHQHIQEVACSEDTSEATATPCCLCGFETAPHCCLVMWIFVTHMIITGCQRHSWQTMVDLSSSHMF